MTDPVNHPKHYTSHPSGVEAIEITRWLRGPYSNACKYVMRGWEGLKGDPITDLKKAIWYLNDAEKFAQDSIGIKAELVYSWDKYYDAEPDRNKALCIFKILQASKWETSKGGAELFIDHAKKLIQDRIAYLQSHPDVAL